MQPSVDLEDQPVLRLHVPTSRFWLRQHPLLRHAKSAAGCAAIAARTAIATIAAGTATITTASYSIINTKHGFCAR
jgi:hypothetical protein